MGPREAFAPCTPAENQARCNVDYASERVIDALALTDGLLPVVNDDSEDPIRVGVESSAVDRGTLAWVKRAASSDETRWNLNAPWASTTGEVCATDGHRLHYAPTGAPVTTGEGWAPIGETMRESDRFPDVRQIMPAEQLAHTFRVDGKALVMALEGVSKPMGRDIPEVSLSVSGGFLTLRARNPDVGESWRVVPIINDLIETRIGVNARYLIDALRGARGGDVTIQIDGELAPLTVTHPDGRRAVIMPMRGAWYGEVEKTDAENSIACNIAAVERAA